MTIAKKSGLIFTVMLISIILSACPSSSEPNAPKNGSSNQSPTSPNVNGVPPVNINSNVAPATTPPLPVVNKNNKSSSTVKQPTPQIGSGGNDMALFAQVRGALSSDKELINKVIVEIKEGNATLTGSVSSEAQKKKAEQLVKGVQGIKSVKNNLKVP